MRTKILSTLLITTILMTSVATNASCIDKYNNEISQRSSEISLKEEHLRAQQRYVNDLKNECFPDAGILGSILALLALPVAMTGVALLSPLAIYSSATAIATMAPFALGGSAMMAEGVHLVKAKPSASSVCSEENFKLLADQLSITSLELINLKFVKYSQEKIYNLLTEVSNNENGPETFEYLRRMKVHLPDTKISNDKLLNFLNEVNQSELICENNYLFKDVKSIELGLEKIIDKSIPIQDIKTHLVANPFIEAEARNKRNALLSTLKELDKRIVEIKKANNSVTEGKSGMGKTMNAPEETLSERKEKYLSLITIKNLLNNGLIVILKSNSSVEKLEKVKGKIIVELKSLDKILGI